MPPRHCVHTQATILGRTRNGRDYFSERQAAGAAPAVHFGMPPRGLKACFDK